MVFNRAVEGFDGMLQQGRSRPVEGLGTRSVPPIKVTSLFEVEVSRKPYNMYIYMYMVLSILYLSNRSNTRGPTEKRAEVRCRICQFVESSTE